MGFCIRGNPKAYWMQFYVTTVHTPDGEFYKLQPERLGGKLKRWPTPYPLTKSGRAAFMEKLGDTQELLRHGKMPKDPDMRPMTVAEWVSTYVHTPEFTKIVQWADRKMVLEKILNPIIGDIPLVDLSETDIRKLRKTLEARPSRLGGTLSRATVNLYHCYVRSMLRTAMEHEYRPMTNLHRNVAALVALPDPQNARDRIVTASEWQRLLALSPEWLRPILMVAFYLGLREGEILNLRWDQIDLDAGRISLRIRETKNKEARQVPLMCGLLDELRKLALKERHPSGLVFVQNGNPIALTTFNRHWSTLRIKAGLGMRDEENGLTFHDLRHCAGTNLRLAGVDFPLVMKILGHKTIKAAMRYQHVVPDEDFGNVIKLHEARLKLRGYARVQPPLSLEHSVDTSKNVIDVTPEDNKGKEEAV